MAEATIRTKYKVLRVMLRNNVNLSNPEEVKLFIARNKNWSNGHKIIAVYAYNDYAKMLGIKWEKPYYKKNETLPFIPTEKEIDALISGTSKKVSITLQALKETGFRIVELWNCKWTDLDEEKSTLKCIAEKHGKPREIKINNKPILEIDNVMKIREVSSFDRWGMSKRKNLYIRFIHKNEFDKISIEF